MIRVHIYTGGAVKLVLQQKQNLSFKKILDYETNKHGFEKNVKLG